MGNSHSQTQPLLVLENVEFPLALTPAFIDNVKVVYTHNKQDPSTWVEKQVERERAKDIYIRKIAESKTVADVTREALDIIKDVQLLQIKTSSEAVNAKNNLENCYALGFPLNCTDQVEEFRKIASSF